MRVRGEPDGPLAFQIGEAVAASAGPFTVPKPEIVLGLNVPPLTKIPPALGNGPELVMVPPLRVTALPVPLKAPPVIVMELPLFRVYAPFAVPPETAIELPLFRVYVPPTVPFETAMELPLFRVYVPLEAPVPEKAMEPPLFTVTAPLTSLPVPVTRIDPLSLMACEPIVKVPLLPMVSVAPELMVKLEPELFNVAALLRRGSVARVPEPIMTALPLAGAPEQEGEQLQLGIYCQVFETPP